MNDLPGIGDQWIREQRGDKKIPDPFRPYKFFSEKERTQDGVIEDVNTIFLTNRECRFTCLMCDLWKNTTDEPVPPGAIPSQIEYALERLPPARHLKLYNGANFFDPGAIPPADYPRIAELTAHFERLIVENHPLLTGYRCLQFARLIRSGLQVAMGLETIHPEVLQRLNKKMVPEDFRKSVGLLNEHGIGSRAFILLRPPFLSEKEGIRWARASIDFAFDSGVECSTIIPTRAGNGAMEKLQLQGHFNPPSLISLEKVLEYGIGLSLGLVFADTWDLEQFSACPHCFEARKSRIESMNRQQLAAPPVTCTCSPDRSGL